MNKKRALKKLNSTWIKRAKNKRGQPQEEENQGLNNKHKDKSKEDKKREYIIKTRGQIRVDITRRG